MVWERVFGCGGSTVAILCLLTSASLADEWWTAVGYGCDEELGQLTVFPISFDANKTHPISRDGLFVQTEDLRDPIVPNEIVSCALTPNRVASLHRIYQNVPKPTGMCGGAPWAKYELKLNDQIAATFPMGCGTTMLVAHQNYVTVCGFGDQGCKMFQDQPLSLSFTGQWETK
ncbi:hypothetical protein BCF46_0532 [Litoreibacter meonggei]|uniref:Secreted protein n=2 Tax=Litoreibacter meonggei TaxID=1049199 RepID=A0A497X5C9_9RHOB|nr:hypothetical protein BCF46_0532 [Litoreibacter meonggei]